MELDRERYNILYSLGGVGLVVLNIEYIILYIFIRESSCIYIFYFNLQYPLVLRIQTQIVAQGRDFHAFLFTLADCVTLGQ